MNRLPFAALCPLAGLLTALLLLHPPAVQAAPAGPRVVVRALGSKALSGTLVALDEKTLQLQVAGEDKLRALPLEGVIDLTLPSPTIAKARSTRFRAWLIGGERLLGRYVAATEDGIRLSVDGFGPIDLSFEVIRTLEAVPGDADPCLDLARRHQRLESGDVAYDARGDEYRGTVLEASAKGVVLESERGRRRTVSWADLRVLHLENDLLEPRQGLVAEMQLVSGSRLAVSKSVTFGAEGFRFALRSLPDAPRLVATASVQTVRWSGGRFLYASSLPFESVHKPYHEDPEDVMDRAYRTRFFGARANARVRGCPLRVGGRTYRYGFGVNSYSTITLNLDGDYASFEGGLGIDDKIWEEPGSGTWHGNVSARILADGKVLWEAKEVRGGEALRRFGPLDVSEVKTLVLEVGFGKEMTILDRADWIEPILVRR